MSAESLPPGIPAPQRGRRSLWHSGIFRKILLSSLVLSVFPLLLFGQRTIDRVYSLLEEETGRSLEARAVHVAEQVSDLLDTAEMDLRALSLLPPENNAYEEFLNHHSRIIRYQETDEYQTREISTFVPLYLEAAFLDSDGIPRILSRTVSKDIPAYGELERVFALASELPEGRSLISHLTGIRLREGEERLGERYFGGIRFASPVYREGQFSGVVTLFLDHIHLASLVRHIHPLIPTPVLVPPRPPGAYAFLVDAEGWIICHPIANLIRGMDANGIPFPAFEPESTLDDLRAGQRAANLNQLGWLHPQYPEVMDRIRSGRSGVTVMPRYRSQEAPSVIRLRSYAPIFHGRDETGAAAVFGGVGMGSEVGPALLAGEIATDFYVVLSIATFLIFGIALVVSRSISRPLLRLSEAASRVGRGELGQDIPIQSRDEIGDLARAFNQMCRDLETYEHELRSAERFASIGETISGTAHAIKTELNVYGLINNAALLARFTPENDPRRKYVDAVREGLERLENVVRNLLSSPPEPRLEILDVRPLLNEVGDEFRHRADSCAIRIERVLPETPCTIEADPLLIKQVLSNLSENAVDAMPEGGTLRFECGYDGNSILIKVADTGTGIALEDQSRVLFPFFTTKRERGGTGLGLYQAYRIIRRHGGTLELQSQPGKGTTVTLRIPKAHPSG